jgi:hypothetical protein
MTLVAASLGGCAGVDSHGAQTGRSAQAVTVCADAHAAIEQAPASHPVAQDRLDVADEDSPDEELIFAAPSSALPRPFASRLRGCTAQTLVSRERHLTLERPPRA